MLTLQDIARSLDPDELRHLTDAEKFGDITPAAEERITDDIRRGWAEVMSYVAMRYPDLAELPDILRDKALDVVKYKLFSRKGIRPGTADETIRDNYLDALKWLQELSLGKVALPLSDDGSGTNPDGEPAQSDLAPSIRADERQYTKDSLKGF